jgi:hypothetical protein
LRNIQYGVDVGEKNEEAKNTGDFHDVSPVEVVALNIAFHTGMIGIYDQESPQMQQSRRCLIATMRDIPDRPS